MYHIKFKHKYFTGLKYSRFKYKAKIFLTFNDAKDFLLTSNIQGVIVKRRVLRNKSEFFVEYILGIINKKSRKDSGLNYNSGYAISETLLREYKE